MQPAATGAPFQHKVRRILLLVVIAIILLTTFVVVPRLLNMERETQVNNLDLLPAIEPPSTQIAVQAGTPTHKDEVEAVDELPPGIRAESLVALVNGVAVDGEMLRVQMLADQAMAGLTGRTQDEALTERVARLINGELVWQAAHTAGYETTAEETTAQLQALLAGYGKDDEALSVALDEADLERSEFDEFFQRLLTVDSYAAAQASERSLSANEYIRNLQDQARISYGVLADEGSAEAYFAQSDRAATEIADSLAINKVSAADDGEVTASAQGAPVQETQLHGSAVGQLAPPFDIPLAGAEGESIAYEDLLGGPSIVSFWTTWCPYCRKQTPVLVDTYEKYADQGLQIAGVNVKEDAAAVSQYLQDNSVDYPVGLDMDGRVASAYAVSGYPTTFFLDADGRILAKHVGSLKPDIIERFFLPELQ